MANSQGAIQLPNEAYTVGWICAINTESVAARALLDEEHGRPIVSHSDNNSYTLGRMCEHNVVIVVLPDGEYGTAAAASAARDLASTFPNIRVGLMVGVGGGAPNAKHDIRLGDVVVSSSRNGNPAVIQYDFGKAIQGQKFEMTRLLDQPPTVLRTAVQKVIEDYELQGHHIQERIDEAFKKWPKIRKRYSRPGVTTDRLFKSNIIHPAGCPDNCAVACASDGSLVVRPIRNSDEDDPMIHYGLVASANQLMKDALIRDELSREKDVLCFEMEAGGLMNHFPCLVIRGICDYLDSHKNKEWQGYAAMTAAAYAKDVISRVHPTQIEAARKIGEILSDVNQNVLDIKPIAVETRAGVNQLVTQQRENDIHRWLSPPDPSTNLKRGVGTRHGNTGRWLLESSAYSTWKNEANSFLWLNGRPGCGKTILSSTVIHDLQMSEDSIATLLYFYFDFNTDEKRSFEKMLRSLLYQLYCTKSGAAKVLDSLFSSCHEGNSQPSLDLLLETFKSMLIQPDSVWIVIDALDECNRQSRTPAEDVLNWITGLLGSCNGIHLLVASRPEHDITQAFEPIAERKQVIHLETQLVEGDIRQYVQYSVREDGALSRWRKRPDILDEIEQALMSKAGGMFRWVSCQIDVLTKCLDPTTLRKALNELPKTLDETYSRIICNIPEEYLPSTKRILQFLTYDGPMTVPEASDAIAVDLSQQPSFSHENRMPITEEVLHYCTSLVERTTDPYTGLGVLQLSHFSVKEWLTSDRVDKILLGELGMMMAHSTIAMVSLAYLIELDNKMYEAEHPYLLEKGMTTQYQPDKSFWGRNYYFLSHAARIWPKHARKVEKNNRAVRNMAAELFSTRCVYKNIHIWFFRRQYYDLLEPHWLDECIFLDSQDAKLLFAAMHGLTTLAQEAIDAGVAVNGHDLTPLYVASYNGHIDTVFMLLERGADVNAYSWALSKSGTAIHAASIQGHERVVSYLLEKGSDPNSLGGYYGNALQAAVDMNDKKIVSLLITNGADVSAKIGLGGHALEVAAKHSDQDMMQLLIDGATDAQDDLYERALMAAVRGKRKDNVSFLLEKCTEISDTILVSLLLFAISSGHAASVWVLLKRGHPSTLIERQFGEALRVTLRFSTRAIMLCLLKKCDCMEIQVEEYMLELAAKNERGGFRILKMLVNDKVEITERVVVAAAGNIRHGSKMFALLLKPRQNNNFKITEKVVKTAVNNTQKFPGIWRHILKNRRHEVRITEETVLAALGSSMTSKWFGPSRKTEIIGLVLKNLSKPIRITDDMLRATLSGDHIKEKALRLLLRHHDGSDICITDDIVNIVAEFPGGREKALMFLLQQKDVRITTSIDFKAKWAAKLSPKLLSILLRQQGDEFIVTQDLFEAMARERSVPMQLLLMKYGDSVKITDNVLTAAIRNRQGEAVLNFILDRYEDVININENILVAVAGLGSSGAKVLEMLLQLKPESTKLSITDKVYEAAGKSWSVYMLGTLNRHVQNLDMYSKWKPVARMFQAARNNDFVQVQYLLAQGVPVDIPDVDGKTTLLISVEWEDKTAIEVVRLLLLNNADVNHQDHDGRSALSEACLFDHVEIAELLLAAGARVDLKDKKGQTAIDLARKPENSYLVELMLRMTRSRNRVASLHRCRLKD